MSLTVQLNLRKGESSKTEDLIKAAASACGETLLWLSSPLSPDLKEHWKNQTDEQKARNNALCILQTCNQQLVMDTKCPKLEDFCKPAPPSDETGIPNPSYTSVKDVTDAYNQFKANQSWGSFDNAEKTFINAMDSFRNRKAFAKPNYMPDGMNVYTLLKIARRLHNYVSCCEGSLPNERLPSSHKRVLDEVALILAAMGQAQYEQKATVATSWQIIYEYHQRSLRSIIGIVGSLTVKLNILTYSEQENGFVLTPRTIQNNQQLLDAVQISMKAGTYLFANHAMREKGASLEVASARELIRHDEVGSYTAQAYFARSPTAVDQEWLVSTALSIRSRMLCVHLFGGTASEQVLQKIRNGKLVGDKVVVALVRHLDQHHAWFLMRCMPGHSNYHVYVDGGLDEVKSSADVDYLVETVENQLVGKHVYLIGPSETMCSTGLRNRFIDNFPTLVPSLETLAFLEGEEDHCVPSVNPLALFVDTLDDAPHLFHTALTFAKKFSGWNVQLRSAKATANQHPPNFRIINDKSAIYTFDNVVKQQCRLFVVLCHGTTADIHPSVSCFLKNNVGGGGLAIICSCYSGHTNSTPQTADEMPKTDMYAVAHCCLARFQTCIASVNAISLKNAKSFLRCYFETLTPELSVGAVAHRAKHATFNSSLAVFGLGAVTIEQRPVKHAEAPRNMFREPANERDGDETVLFPNLLTFVEAFHLGYYRAVFSTTANLQLATNEEASSMLAEVNMLRKKKEQLKANDDVYRFKYQKSKDGTREALCDSSAIIADINAWYQSMFDPKSNGVSIGADARVDLASKLFRYSDVHAFRKIVEPLWAANVTPLLQTETMMRLMAIPKGVDIDVHMPLGGVSSKPSIGVVFRKTHGDNDPRVDPDNPGFQEFVKAVHELAGDKYDIVLLDAPPTNKKFETEDEAEKEIEATKRRLFGDRQTIDCCKHYEAGRRRLHWDANEDKVQGLNKHPAQLQYLWWITKKYNIVKLTGIHGGFLDMMNIVGVPAKDTLRISGFKKYDGPAASLRPSDDNRKRPKVKLPEDDHNLFCGFFGWIQRTEAILQSQCWWNVSFPDPGFIDEWLKG